MLYKLIVTKEIYKPINAKRYRLYKLIVNAIQTNKSYKQIITKLNSNTN